MEEKQPYTEHYLTLKDYFLSQEAFKLYRNPNTGVLKTIPQPVDVAPYYESEEYLSHDDSQKSFFARCYQFAKSFNLKGKKSLISRYATQGKILDIGAGVGDLVAVLKDDGYDAIGFEPNEKARSFAQQKNINLLADSSSIKPQSIQVISMYHVLEHVYDIDQQISQIKDWLQDDGVLILALPNYKSFDARWFKNYWAGYDVPRHLFHFDKIAVQQIFKKDFKLIKTKPMWWDSFYVSILSARYKNIKMAFIYGLMIGMLSNIVALFNKQPSSVVYVLKKRK